MKKLCNTPTLRKKSLPLEFLRKQKTCIDRNKSYKIIKDTFINNIILNNVKNNKMLRFICCHHHIIIIIENYYHYICSVTKYINVEKYFIISMDSFHYAI